MLAVFLLLISLAFTLGQLAYTKKWGRANALEVFISYVLLLNCGVMSILAAYMHVFQGPETAKMIGWAPGSPFQFEIGMANLAFGFLGLTAYSIRGKFWEATLFGWSILLIGCFIGHLLDYFTTGNTAPYNMGMYIWVNDLLLPILLLGCLAYLRKLQTQRFE